MKKSAFFLFLVVLCAAGPKSVDCPEGMVPTGSGTCIDRYEWPNIAGALPLVGASGVLESAALPVRSADELCNAVGKRVCDRREWQNACRGTDADKCNTKRKWKHPDELKVSLWNEKELARLNQSTPSGSMSECQSESGAFDMVGNAEEWVRCEEGVYGWCLMGRFWADARSCSYKVASHAPAWHYYETGFRCCK
jgi:hypothetical protein